MCLTMRTALVPIAVLTLVGPTTQDAGGPNLVIPPHTIRVQAMNPGAKGHWIAMLGYRELGSPCFSRDGRLIAFDAYKEGYNNSRPECWIAQKDGTGLRKLTSGATPRWAPDGSRLLFTRGEENDPGREPGVHVINVDGTDERKIGPGRWPDWSPDGKRIAFSRGGSRGWGVKVGAAIFVARADGTDPEEIVPGDCPSWSPDGTRIACCLLEENRSPLIQVVDLKTKAKEVVGHGWFRANWVADGTAVVANGVVGFCEAGMVRFTIGRREPPTQLFSQFEEASSPCPSPGGKEMVFIAKKPKVADR